MLYVRIEVWPHGDKEKARLLGEGTIANEGSLFGSTSDRGNYSAKLMKSPEYAKNPGIWKKGRIEGFPRLRLGPWDLLYRVLHVCVGDRNRLEGQQ